MLTLSLSDLLREVTRGGITLARGVVKIGKTTVEIVVRVIFPR